MSTTYAVVDLSKLNTYTAHGPLSRDQAERVMFDAKRPLVLARIAGDDVRIVDGVNVNADDVQRCGVRMTKVHAALVECGLLPRKTFEVTA